MFFYKLVLVRKVEPPEYPKCRRKRVEQIFSAFATASANRKHPASCGRLLVGGLTCLIGEHAASP